MQPVELTDERLVVRTYRDDDVPMLFEAVRESIAEVSPWLPWCHENYSIAESREFIKSRKAAAQALQVRDPPTYELVWRTPSLRWASLSFALLSFTGYG